jgi:hypothetical protein
MRALEVGSPAMAVTSSVAGEEDEVDVEKEALAVAFRGPDTTDADILSDTDAMLIEIELLG